MKIGLVGAGSMGSALVAGWLASGLSGSDLVVVDRNDDKSGQWRGEGVASGQDSTALADVDVVVLAVKPHHTVSAAAELATTTRADCIVLSVAAGVGTAEIEAVTGARSVLRAMPNTPAIIGRGMTAVCGGSRARAEAVSVGVDLMGAVGDVVVVDEGDMDAVTAISGSGPAYLFYLAEAMMAAAVEQGISTVVADRLVRQTLAGAAELLGGELTSPGQLRKNVTSPGGTTEAAIGVFDSAGLNQIVGQAVAQAARRSKELAE